MKEGIHCIMNNAGSLNDQDRDMLFLTAQQIFCSSKSRKKFRTDTMEGTVETKREYGMLGTLIGVKFMAIVETKRVEGVQKIEYLVRERMLAPDSIGRRIRWRMASEIEDRIIDARMRN